MRQYYYRFQKLIIYGIITLMATQLIYLNTEYGFIHIILFALYLMIYDVYKVEYRDHKKEILNLILFVFAVVVLMLSQLLGDYTRFLYYPLIFILSVLNIRSILMFKNDFKNRNLNKINNRNIVMFQKEGKFLIVYSYTIVFLLSGIAVFSLANIFYY